MIDENESPVDAALRELRVCTLVLPLSTSPSSPLTYPEISNPDLGSEIRPNDT